MSAAMMLRSDSSAAFKTANLLVGDAARQRLAPSSAELSSCHNGAEINSAVFSGWRPWLTVISAAAISAAANGGKIRFDEMHATL
jgi:hypothetical protein